MDRSKFDDIAKVFHKIEACDKILQADIPTESVFAQIGTYQPTHVFIPRELWDKFLQLVKEHKLLWEEQFKNM